MARWQTQFFPPLLSSSLSIFFHSPSHSLLKRLSHWFAFCCGESREVAQCVLVKAVPHLPGIIRQLCWKDPSLIPLRWPISHHKGVPGLVFLADICSFTLAPIITLLYWYCGHSGQENILLPILTGLYCGGEKAKGNIGCCLLLNKNKQLGKHPQVLRLGILMKYHLCIVEQHSVADARRRKPSYWFWLHKTYPIRWKALLSVYLGVTLSLLMRTVPIKIGFCTWEITQKTTTTCTREAYIEFIR